MAGLVSRSRARNSPHVQKRRERQRLLELDQHLLSDIGVTREQAEKEATKWTWE
jgi:uncharacterized protein YjiS (DUF1127 family)